MHSLEREREGTEYELAFTEFVSIGACTALEHFDPAPAQQSLDGGHTLARRRSRAAASAASAAAMVTKMNAFVTLVSAALAAVAACAALPTAAVAAAAAAGSAPVPPKSVLVFENERFQAKLAAALGEPVTYNIVDCSQPRSCNPPPDEIRESVVAVVASLPRNVSLFPDLPNLKLLQSGWYINPVPSTIKPESVGMSIYFPDYKNLTSKEDGIDALAEATVAMVVDWNYNLAQKERAFRQCALSGGTDAPLDCPVFSDMTTHTQLWKSGKTIGLIGFGAVGKGMARHFSAMGMDVIASDIEGPYSPLPPGLKWFGADNDHVIRSSDYLIPATPAAAGFVVNKTSLGLMKPTAVVIPTDPRQADYGAMYDALRGKAIGGAILDTFPIGCWGVPVACGPPYGAATLPWASGNDFTALPNVRLTPNTAMQTVTFWDNSAAFAAVNLKSLAEGRPLAGMVRNITRA